MASWFLVVALSLTSRALALPTEQEEGRSFQNAIPGHTREDMLVKIYSDCVKRNSVPCIKFKLFSYVDRLLSKDYYHISDNVALVKTTDAVGSPDISVAEDGSPRNFNDAEVDNWISSRMQNYLRSHSITINLGGNDVLEAVNSAGRALSDAAENLGLIEEEGRGKKKKKDKKKEEEAARLMYSLLVGIKLMVATVITIALGKLALLAGKALVVAKVALVLSAVIGLKKLFSHHEKSVTYEVVTHPHYTHETSHGRNSYGNIEMVPLPANVEPQELAYSRP